MWKKDDAAQTGPRPDQPEATPPRNEAITSPGRGRGPATIGRSITIRGEVTGDEDLLIEGRVDGSVDLKQHSVTVGPDGKVKAGISGRVVTVEGTVEGDLHAEEQVVLRATARVQGDITAPRVVLEDGATFRGGVEMGESTQSQRPRSTRPPESRAGADSRTGSASATGSESREKGGEAASKASSEAGSGRASGASA